MKFNRENDMEENREERIRGAVRENYAEVARRGASKHIRASTASCCGEPASAEAGPDPSGIGSAGGLVDPSVLDDAARRLGYGEEELKAVPEGANMGLGCGNPTAIASLKAGETVLDLGSGGGFDCFLAAHQVGPEGHVIGVDMTTEMISKARENARKGDFANVEFRLGEIEHLPVADGSTDVIITNCVINLSPDKPAVYRDAFRALKPGGRIAVSDVVATVELPEEVRNDMKMTVACIGGADTITNLESILQEVGFENIRVIPKDESREFIREWEPGRGLEDYIVSANIEAVKPG